MNYLFDIPFERIRIIWVDPATKIILATADGRKNIASRLGTLITSGMADTAHIGANIHTFLADPRIVLGRITTKGFYAIKTKQKMNGKLS